MVKDKSDGENMGLLGGTLEELVSVQGESSKETDEQPSNSIEVLSGKEAQKLIDTATQAGEFEIVHDYCVKAYKEEINTEETTVIQINDERPLTHMVIFHLYPSAELFDCAEVKLDIIALFEDGSVADVVAPLERYENDSVKDRTVIRFDGGNIVKNS